MRFPAYGISLRSPWRTRVKDILKELNIGYGYIEMERGIDQDGNKFNFFVDYKLHYHGCCAYVVFVPHDYRYRKNDLGKKTWRIIAVKVRPDQRRSWCRKMDYFLNRCSIPTLFLRKNKPRDYYLKLLIPFVYRLKHGQRLDTNNAAFLAAVRFMLQPGSMYTRDKATQSGSGNLDADRKPDTSLL